MIRFTFNIFGISSDLLLMDYLDIKLKSLLLVHSACQNV